MFYIVSVLNFQYTWNDHVTDFLMVCFTIFLRYKIFFI